LPRFSRLTDSDRDRVHELLDQYADAHECRVRQRVAVIERTARALGAQVARHDLTREHAATRLEALATCLDPTCPVPLYLIPYRVALDIARRAFAAGVREVLDGR
jgi:hypothetical protein